METAYLLVSKKLWELKMFQCIFMAKKNQDRKEKWDTSRLSEIVLTNA